MITFQLLDWIWLILFVLLMVFFGFYFYRFGKRSQSDYFLADRGLPWWLPASSVYATHTATDTPIWVAGVVYKYGFAGLWYAFYAAWCAISAFVSTRIFRRSLAYSQAEWQTLRFGELGAELLRGWIAGWSVFMNMFILGWVGIAMGKLCAMLFGWDLYVGLLIFTAIGAVYVYTSGYWGVVMADFQQGVIALLVIIIVSVYGVVAAGGPTAIISKLDSYNSTCEWKVPDVSSSNVTAVVRIIDPELGTELSRSAPFTISVQEDEALFRKTEEKVRASVVDEASKTDQRSKVLFPDANSVLLANHGYNIVWAKSNERKFVDVEFSLDNGMTWDLIAKNQFEGQSWRLNPMSFTGMFEGQFPVAWFIT
jgi:Na+(H+)/acetate symporter ActP